MSGKQKSASLIVAGAAVPVTLEEVALTELELDPENPRIRFQFTHGAAAQPQSQAELMEIVKSQPGYDDLQKQIRKQEGIHDPLIVRHDGRIIEGNSRFTALSVLSSMGSYGKRWSHVPIFRLAPDVAERTIQLLMADYHIAGKTTWRPAAQADQIYRMVEESKISIEAVADATRMTVKKVQQHLDAYSFLINEVLPIVPDSKRSQRQAILEKKFSHALEFASRKDFAAIRAHASDRKLVAKLVANDPMTGLQTRKLPGLMANSEAKETLRKHGYKAAEAAFKANDPTADSPLLKAMRGMTSKLKGVDQTELRLFQSDKKIFKILSELANAADELVALAATKKVAERA